MSQFQQKPIPSHKAPWPPGVNTRTISHPKLGEIRQVRLDSFGDAEAWADAFMDHHQQQMAELMN